MMNALAGDLGARPKGRPQYILQWELPEGVQAYAPPPVSLPAWARTDVPPLVNVDRTLESFGAARPTGSSFVILLVLLR